MLVCVCSSEEQRVRSVAAFVERPAAAGHTLLKHVCFVVLRETGTAGAGVAEILWAEFWNGWSFFEVTTHCDEWVSLHQDDLRSCEQSSVEIIIFLSPLPPLQGCSWVMTSLLHLAGTLRIMSWLGMSHHSGNPVCVEAIAQISSTHCLFLIDYWILVISPLASSLNSAYDCRILGLINEFNHLF